jgi:hypothetical protein
MDDVWIIPFLGAVFSMLCLVMVGWTAWRRNFFAFKAIRGLLNLKTLMEKNVKNETKIAASGKQAPNFEGLNRLDKEIDGEDAEITH